MGRGILSSCHTKLVLQLMIKKTKKKSPPKPITLPPPPPKKSKTQRMKKRNKRRGLILLEDKMVSRLGYSCKKQRAYCFLYRCFTHDERNADG